MATQMTLFGERATPVMESPTLPYNVMASISQNIQNFLQMAFQADVIMKLKARQMDFLLDSFEAAEQQKAAGKEGDAKLLLDEILRLYGGLYDNWAAGIWGGVGTAWSSSMETFLQSGQLLYAYKTLMYNVAVVPRMRRHWNRAFTPNAFDTPTAFRAYMHDRITFEEYISHAAWDGWTREDASVLLDIMERNPDPQTAFNMWMRGIITEEQRDAVYKKNGYPEGWWEELTTVMSRGPDPETAFNMWLRGLITLEERNERYKAAGFPEEWHDKLTESMMYLPSVFDLLRIADFVEVDQIWALDILKKRGLSEKDRAKIWELIQLRPLREEVRGLTTEYVWRYRYGRSTFTELHDGLTKLGIKTKERELLENRAQMLYRDELVNEWISILTWRFRTAVISEEEFLDGLLDLDIRHEKANLIVEEQKAMGYYGYY